MCEQSNIVEFRNSRRGDRPRPPFSGNIEMPPKNPKAPSPGDEWIRANTAVRRFGISAARLSRLALAGEVRTIVEPGSTPRFAASDVERIASRPA
jgi:hypothetical protein